MHLTPLRSTIFSTDVFSGVRNFQCVYCGSLCCICGPINMSSWPFLWFQHVDLSMLYFLSLVIGFYSLYSSFSGTTRGLDPFSGEFLNNLTVSMMPSDRE